MAELGPKLMATWLTIHTHKLHAINTSRSDQHTAMKNAYWSSEISNTLKILTPLPLESRIYLQDFSHFMHLFMNNAQTYIFLQIVKIVPLTFQGLVYMRVNTPYLLPFSNKEFAL